MKTTRRGKKTVHTQQQQHVPPASDPVSYANMPFPPKEVDDFLRRADLEKLLKNYKPSQLSQKSATKKKGKSPTVFKLRKRDILCGRGNHINKLPGNVLMRQAVSVNQKCYHSLNRGMKKIAADALIAYFESWDIRFLENDETTVCDKNASYALSPYDRVAEKMMQALREKVFMKTQPPMVQVAKKAKITKSKQSSGRSCAANGLNKAPDSKVSTTKTSSRVKAKGESVPSAPTRNSSYSSEGTGKTDNSPRAVTEEAAPVVLQGSYAQPVAAPVLSLATFLRKQMQKR